MNEQPLHGTWVSCYLCQECEHELTLRESISSDCCPHCGYGEDYGPRLRKVSKFVPYDAYPEADFTQRSVTPIEPAPTQRVNTMNTYRHSDPKWLIGVHCRVCDAPLEISLTTSLVGVPDPCHLHPNATYYTNLTPRVPHATPKPWWRFW